MIIWSSDNGEESTVIFYSDVNLIFIEEILWYSEALVSFYIQSSASVSCL